MNNPVKIMHVVLSLECGGLEKMAIDLASGLDIGKYTSSICCINTLGELAESAIQRGIQVFCLEKKSGFDVLAIFKLAKLLKKEKISIVHSHNPGAMIYAAVAAKIAGVPVIINTRHGRERKVVNRYLWAMNDAIVSISYDAQQRLLECNHIDAGKTRVIHNGIEVAEHNGKQTRIEDVAHDDVVIGTVGRLAPEKDYVTLLDAFALIADKIANAKLLFVGDGALRNELEQHCLRNRIADKVIFLGFRNDVRDLLKSMDMFVLPSLTEGISLGLLEAMAAGLPVVATDVGGNPEVIKNGVNGFLVPSKNPNALAERIAAVLSNRDLSLSMGDGGRKTFEAKFTLARMLKEYENLYAEILQKRNIA